VYKIVNPTDSSFFGPEKVWLERIGRLFGFEPSPLTLAVYLKEKDGKKRAAFLETYERFLFCQSLIGRAAGFGRIYRPNNFYIEYISGRESISDVTTLLDNMVVQFFHESSASEIINDWVKGGASFYGWRSVKYFLFEYEMELQAATKSNREKIDWDVFSSESYKGDYDTIEHIYPQRARDPYWTERFGYITSSPHKRLLRNSLGNLLALAKPRNSSLGNKSFPEKLGDDKKMTGYRYGSYSENEVALSKEWTPDHIVDRGVRMLDFLERRWKIIIGDRGQKVRALGLEFMDSPKLKKRI
jgi:hypothetical protein